MPDELATLTVKADEKFGTIHRNLYGIGCFDAATSEYPLWVGSQSSVPNISGVRRDAIEAVRKLDPGVIGMPRGLYYRWREGVGPEADRPERVWYWGRSPRQKSRMKWRRDFGTDEFVRFCRQVGSDRLLACNDELPMEGREWVEYCNYTGESDLARMRSEYGSEESHDVRFWYMDGWRDLDPVEYAKAFRKFAIGAKCLDPRVELILAGGSPAWNDSVFETLNHVVNRNIGGTDLIDHVGMVRYCAEGISDHRFTDDEYYKVVANAAEFRTEIRRLSKYLERHDRDRDRWASDWLNDSEVGSLVTRIAYLEWGTKHVAERQTMRDAIAHAEVLDTFHQFPNQISLAMMWLHMLLQCRDGKIWPTPTYHVFNLYRKHHENESIGVEVGCDPIVVDHQGDQASGVTKARYPSISATASISRDKKNLVITMTNRHLENRTEAMIYIPELGKLKLGRVSALTSDNVRDFNDSETPDRVRPKAYKFTTTDLPIHLMLEPFSVNTLHLEFE